MTMISKPLQLHNKCEDANVIRRMKVLLKVGCKLMESSADTQRILRNMKRTAAFLGFKDENLQIYADYNLLMVNYSDDRCSYTKFQRCSNHAIDMAGISAISKLSWRAIANDYTLDQFEDEFDEICARPRVYKPWQVALGGGLACGGFCIQFGCDWPSFFYASIAAAVGLRMRMYLASKK